MAFYFARPEEFFSFDACTTGAISILCIRLYYVHCSYQFIYAFRFVNRSMESIRAQLRHRGFAFSEASLNVCQRCPIKTINLAGKIVPGMTARGDAKVGCVSYVCTSTYRHLHQFARNRFIGAGRSSSVVVMFRTNKEILSFLHELYSSGVTDGLPICWTSPHIQEMLQSCLPECFKTDDPSEIIEILQGASVATVFRVCHPAMKQKPEHILRVIAQQLQLRDPADYLLWLIACLSRGSNSAPTMNDGNDDNDTGSPCSSSSSSLLSLDVTVTSAHGAKGCTFEGPVLLVDYARYGQNPNTTDDSNLLYVP